MFLGDIPRQARLHMIDELAKTAGTLSGAGLRLELPQSILAGQTGWPEDCPMSEPELRAEVQTLLDDAKALQESLEALKDSARELYARLPEAASAELEGELPPSIYFALVDCVSFIIDEDGVNGITGISYLEERLDDTPETMRIDWLKYHLKNSVSALSDGETREALEEIAEMLCRSTGRHG